MSESVATKLLMVILVMFTGNQLGFSQGEAIVNSAYLVKLSKEANDLGMTEVTPNNVNTLDCVDIQFTTQKQAIQFQTLQTKVSFHRQHKQAPSQEYLMKVIQTEKVAEMGISHMDIGVFIALRLFIVTDEFGLPTKEAVEKCYKNNSNWPIRNQCIELLFKIDKKEGRKKADGVMVTDQVPLPHKIALAVALMKYDYLNSYRIMASALCSPQGRVRSNVPVLMPYFERKNGQECSIGIIDTKKLVSDALKKAESIQSQLKAVQAAQAARAKRAADKASKAKENKDSDVSIQLKPRVTGPDGKPSKGKTTLSCALDIATEQPLSDKSIKLKLSICNSSKKSVALKAGILLDYTMIRVRFNKDSSISVPQNVRAWVNARELPPRPYRITAWRMISPSPDGKRAKIKKLPRTILDMNDPNTLRDTTIAIPSQSILEIEYELYQLVKITRTPKKVEREKLKMLPGEYTLRVYVLLAESIKNQTAQSRYVRFEVEKPVTVTVLTESQMKSRELLKKETIPTH